MTLITCIRHVRFRVEVPMCELNLIYEVLSGYSLIKSEHLNRHK